jgi:hypothetical protein
VVAEANAESISQPEAMTDHSIPTPPKSLSAGSAVATVSLEVESPMDQSQTPSTSSSCGSPASSIPKADIGHLLSKPRSLVSESEIRCALQARWAPVNKSEFPMSYHKKGGKVRPRCLGQQHLSAFPWLAVSRLSGFCGAWCVFCTLFKTSNEGGGRAGYRGGSGGQIMAALVNRPSTNFSDVTGRDGCLEVHERTQFHAACAVKATTFLQCADPAHPDRDVRNIISSARQRDIERNRSALTSIIDTVRLCATQNIALRGHRDNGPIDPSAAVPSINDGNFRALLRFRLRAGDESLREHLQSAPRNAQYTSKTIQNELLEDMTQLVVEHVVKDVAAAGVWTVMADETTDRGKTEQLAVVVRYVSLMADDGTYVLNEEPVAIVDLIAGVKAMASNSATSDSVTTGDSWGLSASSSMQSSTSSAMQVAQTSSEFQYEEIKLTGTAVGTVIAQNLHRLQLSLATLVGQGNDGASSMSSERVGVAAHIKAIAPLADYYHCAMHALNLSCSRAVSVTEMRHTQDVLQDMTNFFRYAKRNDFLADIVKTESPIPQRQQLVTLCTTRFVERHTAVAAAWDLLPFTITALQHMKQWRVKGTGHDATSLLNNILKVDFLIGLVCLREVSALLRPVSVGLQQVHLDLIQGLADVRDAITVLRRWREESDAEFNKLFKEVESFAQKYTVSITKPRLASRSCHRSNAAADQSPEVYYRVNVFIPMLDEVICDLEARFSKHHEQSFTLSRLIPSEVLSTTWEEVLPVVNKYSGLLTATVSTVKGEYIVWQQHWRSEQHCEIPTNALDALNKCPRVTMPNIHLLLKVLATLPVSTATPERIFSKVERTLTSLRSTMSEERLEALILLQAHRDRITNMSTEDIIRKFAASGSRRLEFDFPL